MIQRYDCRNSNCVGIYKSDNGEYVLFEDAKKLMVECVGEQLQIRDNDDSYARHYIKGWNEKLETIMKNIEEKFR